MYPTEGWQYEKVKEETEVVSFTSYAKSHLPEVEKDVELSKIVGTDHDNYNKGNWLRMQSNVIYHARYTVEKYVDMAQNPDDYSSGPEPICVKQYGDEYILCQSGNHRVCHAKFAGLTYIRARVQQYLIDPTKTVNFEPVDQPNFHQSMTRKGWLSKILG
jgi:hypothetical protein